MFTISKFDKKVWDNYVSNFEKSILIPKKTVISNSSGNNKVNSGSSRLLNRSKSFKKNKLKPNIILDLHGYTLDSAKLLLHKFICDCYEKNVRNILIITGKGINNKGVLKEEVPKWLNDEFINKFLVNFSIAPKNFGGEGALIVKIKNRYKKANY